MLLWKKTFIGNLHVSFGEFLCSCKELGTKIWHVPHQKRLQYWFLEASQVFFLPGGAWLEMSRNWADASRFLGWFRDQSWALPNWGFIGPSCHILRPCFRSPDVAALSSKNSVVWVRSQHLKNQVMIKPLSATDLSKVISLWTLSFSYL